MTTTDSAYNQLREAIRAEVLDELRRDPCTTLLGIPLPRLHRYICELQTYVGCDVSKWFADTDKRAESMAKAWCKYVPGLRYPANPVFGERSTDERCPRCNFEGVVVGPELEKKGLLRCPNCGCEITFDAINIKRVRQA